jgi:hypothetical protein
MNLLQRQRSLRADTEPVTGQHLVRETKTRATNQNLGTGTSACERGRLGETGKTPGDGSEKEVRVEPCTRAGNTPGKLAHERESSGDRKKDQLEMAARKTNSAHAQIWLAK